MNVTVVRYHRFYIKPAYTMKQKTWQFTVAALVFLTRVIQQTLYL